MTLDTAMMLALILTEMTIEEVSVETLLKSDELIEIAPNATVKPEGAGLILATGRRSVEHLDELEDVLVQGTERITEHALMQDQVFDAQEKILSPEAEFLEERGIYFVSLSQVTLSDERNAQKLGLTVPEFCAWSVRFWGRLLSQEVDARTPEGVTAQKKGHITRELMMEFRIRIKMAHGDD